jgi:ATP-dependent Clp protease ATP-binding subunit ClpX
LMTVLEQVFRNFKFELPSTGIKNFSVDAATVAEPARALNELLRSNAEAQRDILRQEVSTFAERFEREHGFTLVFTEDAVTALIDLSLKTDKTIRALCEERFRNFHHGLKLLAQGQEDTRFSIDGEVVKDPDKAISRWVVDRFRGQPTPA